MMLSVDSAGIIFISGTENDFVDTIRYNGNMPRLPKKVVYSVHIDASTVKDAVQHPEYKKCLLLAWRASAAYLLQAAEYLEKHPNAI